MIVKAEVVPVVLAFVCIRIPAETHAAQPATVFVWIQIRIIAVLVVILVHGGRIVYPEAV